MPRMAQGVSLKPPRLGWTEQSQKKSRILKKVLDKFATLCYTIITERETPPKTKGDTKMYEVWYENEFFGYADNFEEAEEMVISLIREYEPDSLFIVLPDTEPDYDEWGFDPYLGCYTDDC
jgi:hypothetical protein